MYGSAAGHRVQGETVYLSICADLLLTRGRSSFSIHQCRPALESMTDVCFHKLVGESHATYLK
jgi:hypothetical protein